MSKKINNIVQIIIALVVGSVIVSIATWSPFPSPFKSTFEVKGFYYRKTPPQYNVASYYTNSTDKEEILKYAKQALPWNGQETIIIFFFNDRAHTPDVTISGVNWPKKYEPYCIAIYSKMPNGSESFQEHPFKNTPKGDLK